MKQKFSGVLVLFLLSAALIIASIIIFKETVTIGFIYLGMTFLCTAAVLYAYCAKCSYKQKCSHIFPGKAALHFERETGPYTKSEITVVIISFLLIFGIPQYWLRFYPLALIIFWLLIITSLIIIPILLCPECDNTYCPFRKHKQ